MRIRMRGVVAAVAVSTLCLTAAACESSSGDDKKPGTTDSAKPQETTKTEAPAATTPLTVAQMKAATVELKDLPAGWKTNKVSAGDDKAPKADSPGCQPIADMLGDEIKGSTKGSDVDFKQADGKSELSQQVFTFAGTGAADFTEAIGTALGTCTKVSFDMEGQKVPVKIQKLQAPEVGEGSHAFQMAIEFAPGMEIKANLLVAHQGTGATRVAYVNDGGGAAQKNFEDLVQRVGDKFVKGVKG
ncbi:hypothetical protein FBY35_6031 [Streptomyces sp. SLBN-118]|uniref:hypothetical protein n=1 Tax=Streptomyces sp. SLBN-118 TaxID=2768454 RepID=UPI00114E4A5E|nr:hypothetical protein [Streptomyces sp. SLBN-118]TQK44522.1 hypothetical protein FBY35_6031 [Streptomyces sp. SLBN-118]